MRSVTVPAALSGTYVPQTRSVCQALSPPAISARCHINEALSERHDTCTFVIFPASQLVSVGVGSPPAPAPGFPLMLPQPAGGCGSSSGTPQGSVMVPNRSFKSYAHSMMPPFTSRPDVRHFGPVIEVLNRGLRPAHLQRSHDDHREGATSKRSCPLYLPLHFRLDRNHRLCRTLNVTGPF